MKNGEKNAARRALRVSIAVLWVSLGTAIFLIFRGHTLLVDNRDTDAFRAKGPVTVSVDGKPGVSFFQGDRDRFTVRGPKHRIRIEFADGTDAVEAEFRLAVREDTWILSVPRLLGGETPFVEVFSGVAENRPAEDGEPAETEGASPPVTGF
ncbi:MAG: hypothetical protein LBC88_07130 [Spirochaetaceae bacterium]|jgi:hypothetical protein|nr:hypothetical protein [Spirochaetaceae bacterium]